MERYQLSQDFQEKQLQMLQGKYGGAQQAMHAALKIQRAFRRYSMAKKFADLTAHAKTEKRMSRRLEYQTTTSSASASASTPPPSNSISSGIPPSIVTVNSPHHLLVRTSSRDEPDSSSSNNHLLHHHHHHHHHHVNHHRRMYVHHRTVACPEWQQQQQHVVHQVLPPSVETFQEPTPIILHESSANSSPDIQSFLLDETSVYSHSSSSPSARQSSAERRNARVDSSNKLSRKPNSAPSVPALAVNVSAANISAANSALPSVPRRTISRLSSEEGKPKPRKSPLQAHQSSPQICLNRSGHHSGGGSVTSPPEECRYLRHNLSYRPSDAGSGSVSSSSYTVNEVIRKRHYRTGLNIFNKKPEKGIAYLIRQGFLENSPQAVARFLITRKGLSKQMIGEYLGNLNFQFNMSTLNFFALEMDFAGMQIDTALRKFQTYFRMPGEAQKIERLMEVFSSRFCQCNQEQVSRFRSTDTAFILAFAIILLNTDLHTPSLKPEKRMKLDDFVRNLRGIDNGRDVDQEVLAGIYDRIRVQEFRPGSDHVTQVMKVQQTIVAKCPNLAVPHRRLVCYCRLYEVHDPYKKERPGIHQREVFLFNDILVITKIHSRKKSTVTYAFRQSHILAGMLVNQFETPFYPYGIQIVQKWDRKVIVMLNARNEHDRSKFAEDLRESVAEMDELETLRLEGELEKQRLSLNDNRDSGISDNSTIALEGNSRVASSSSTANNANGVRLRRSAINNSLLDLSEAIVDKITRRGSVGSLGSGMSVSFQSNAGSFMLSSSKEGDDINRNDRNFAASHNKQ